MRPNLTIAPFVRGWFLTVALVSRLDAQTSNVSAILEARIGAVDGPNALGRVEALAVDHAGSVYVLEGDEHRVRVFDRQGQFIRVLGRRGHGPGELADPVGLAWAPDSTLWIIDPGNNRASVYAPNGEFVRDRRLPSAFSLAPWPGRFDRAGNLYHYAPAPNGDDFAYVMVEYDEQLTPVDTVVPPPPREPAAVLETRTDRWGVVRAAVPFAPQLIWRLGADGRMWWTWTARYEIFAGVEARDAEIVTSHVGPRVTRADREAALEGLSRFREVGGRIEPARIPDQKPALRTFFLDDLDNVWVMPELAAGQTGRRLDWFDQRGHLLGEVTLPIHLSAAPPPVVRSGWLYGVTRDDLDVPYVVVFRLRHE